MRMSTLPFVARYRSAPVSVQELQSSVEESDQIGIVDLLLRAPWETDSIVLSICNRARRAVDCRT
jgi:hypothetical protein